ncbi:DNA topoisomerase 2 [Sporobolomyces salmoneus]|uniref:DNA topoisomerase 2 n=1 Tax=Sporobolomyces salmoneus TaxID=183962 RepID=UPI00316C2F0E
MPRYADSDEEEDFYDSGGSEEFVAAPKAKKAAKPATKAKAPAKAKAAPKKKSAALQERDENVSDGNEMDDDVDELPKKKTTAATKGKNKSASETYVKLSQLEHVLKRPDTYIGSVEPVTQPMWVYDEEAKSLVYRTTTFVPGLYKIVDEILVNAADNKVRDASMSELKVKIDVESKTISVRNDGRGIPVEIHETEGIWIPELIFGQLLTSSNYDDDEEKVTGGRNGYGAKLANIYSTEFIVETADSKTGKKYKQVFNDNMSKKGKPKITDNKKGEDWTEITFTPDLKRFNMQDFDKDTVSLLQKRVYDMAGITKGVKVFLNGKKLAVRNFKAFVEMFANGINEVASTGSGAGKGKGKKDAADNDLDLVGATEAAKPTVIYEQFGDRWEVAFAVSDGQFQQVSYCNAIATTKGGTHVAYIADQIVNGLVDLVKKKNKAVAVKPFQIKNHLHIFVNCLVNNPTFDSQTKENMTLGIKKFGSKCELSEDFLKKVSKSGVVDNVLNWAKFKQDQMLKKTDGHKRSRITGLVKLEDANNAGTKNGSKCTLILTEGDSAKALAVSGLSVVGRDNYGVFPLRGKLLNVREATGKALLENAEIQAIKQILGLQQGKVYQNTDSLRYGSLMIMADQDHDGSHIKGLIINFLDYWFPSLLKLPNFLVEFITPIVKVSKNKKEISFFTIPEYEQWKEETSDGRGWKIKYFKGLGTSDASDAKKYFGDMTRHRLPFKTSTAEDRALIDMAFNKKKADDRKEWLRGFVPGTFMNHNVDQVPISDFINKELILFSMADNIRSIPSVVDGFKPGQRKVLFACFKRKLKAEIKVGQLSGYVSEHSAYHHGDASLQGTIIGLAQDFVGSNNVNILDPNGQFGTRLQGGKDAASARYIFTNVAQITRAVFHPADDEILEYLNDDGQSIEPTWYIPILPMVLVNGSDGIGTGWSSFVPNYNPSDIVDNLKRKIKGEEMESMHPWYRGFRGTIEKGDKEGYKCSGIISRIDDSTVEITELPIRTWTQSYKEMLESWVAGSEKQPIWVKDYKEYHTDTTVHFIVTLTDKGKEAIEKDGLEKVFKIVGKVNTSNMVCFDPAGKIKKYTTPEEIVSDFYDVRLEYYHKRKRHLVSELELVHDRLSNQARFIQCIIKKEIVLSNRKRADIVAELRKMDFRPFPKVAKAHIAAAVDENGEEEDPDAEAGADSDYDYLLSMSLSSLTAEKVAKLLAERDLRHDELEALLKLSVQDLWLSDLDAFSSKWQALLEKDASDQAKSLRAAKGKGKGAARKRAANVSDDDDDFIVAKPQAKKPAVVKKAKAKPAVPLPPSDDAFEMEVDQAPVKATSSKASSVEPTRAKGKVTKKRQAVDLDLSEEEEKKSSPPAAKKKKTKKAAKPAEEDDESGDDDIYSMPVSKPKAAPKKAATKKKPAKLASDDDDDEPVAVPRPRAPRRAAVKTYTAPVLELDDDDDVEESFQVDDEEEEVEDSFVNTDSD